MKRRVHFFVILLLSTFLISTSVTSLSKAADPTNIFLVSEGIDNSVYARITLDPQFVTSNESQIGSSLSSYDTVVLFDYLPTSSEIDLLLTYQGGILIFIGPNLVSNTTLLRFLGLTSSFGGEMYDGYMLPIPEDSMQHPILDNIQWNSVPTVANYSSLQLTGRSLLQTSSISENPGLSLICSSDMENHLAINFLPNEEFNGELIQWPYFNYLLYISLMTVSEETPLSYAKWQYSPVPHMSATIVLGISVLLTVGITVTGFLYARKYSRDNPIKESDLSEMSKEVKDEKDWDDVGMHRQLGGFLVQLFIGLLIILPNVVMSALIFPLLILPSPQAAGFYDFTVDFFEALWLFFDIGTSIVLVTYFAKHRVKKPQQAIKYVQIFVWYQMLSGILQLFLISFIGSMVFPHTSLAHFSWMFVTHAFFQWPAFFVVFMLIFQAMNRHDLYQILNLLLYAILNITLQYGVIVLFRLTLGPNPVFGDGLAGAIGYSVGNYVIQVTTFLIGLWFFKRLGFSLKSIFRIDFKMDEIKESLRFGFKWMAGNILPPLGWFIQLFLLSRFLPNYTEQQGYFGLAWNFAMIVMLAGLFANSLLPGISESFHAKKKVLTRYYTVSSLKWSAYFDWFFVAALMALGPKFIRGGAGAEWEGAALLIPWILIFHSIGYFSWLGDWMFAGSDRPGWAATSWVIEQILRIGLLAIFIPQHSFFARVFNSPMVAVMFAYIPALIIKNIFMWWGIRRNDYFKFKWKDVFWQGVIAPLIAAGALFGVLFGLFELIWQGEIITSIVILVIGTMPGLYLYAFFVGLLGGFDKNTLDELDRATSMAKGLKFMSRPLFRVTAWAAKISPLHNKFKISIYEEAIKEAADLTEEKTKLVI